MDTRSALSNLNHALRNLHQALVKVVRHEYENDWGPVDPGQLLQLLTRHPQFDWLHQLSEFMVDIDELLDEDAVTESTLRTVYAETAQLITPKETAPSEFSTRYVEALHRDPSLVMAHAAVRRLLDTV